jgi:hypothetical protein
VAGREGKRGECQTGLGLFGAKPAQSEATVRAAAKRRPTRGRTEWEEDMKLPECGDRSIPALFSSADPSRVRLVRAEYL